MSLTIEQVDAMAKSNRARHYIFTRFVLGEDHFTSACIAASAAREPLTVKEMTYLNEHWNDSEYIAPNTKDAQ